MGLQQAPAGTHRYNNLHALFRKLGEAALAEKRFTIEVDPVLRPALDPKFQQVVNMVRERRQQEQKERHANCDDALGAADGDA